MTALRSLVFNIAMWATTALVAIIFLPGLLGPRSIALLAMETWAKLVMAELRLICGLKYEIRGLEHAPKSAALVAMKHQSMWDTIILHLLLKDPAIVLKQELARIPGYGWYAVKSGMIAVNRDAGSKAMRHLISQSKARLAENRSIAIFPEGTRQGVGAAPDYKVGVAAIYKQCNVPCVPVAVNSGMFWGRRGFAKKPGTVVVEFLEPIEPGLKRGAFMEQLAGRIEPATDALVAEAAASQSR